MILVANPYAAQWLGLPLLGAPDQQFEYAKLQGIAVSSSLPQAMAARWVNKRTSEVEVLPSGIEPGWNYNPGKSREQALKADLAAKGKHCVRRSQRRYERFRLPAYE